MIEEPKAAYLCHKVDGLVSVCAFSSVRERKTVQPPGMNHSIFLEIGFLTVRHLIGQADSCSDENEKAVGAELPF